MEGCKSELDLFSRPNIQTSIKASGYYPVTPVTKYDSITGSIEFNIVSQNGRYLDLSDINMDVIARLQYTDSSTAITKDYEAYGSNNLLHTVFSNIELWFNETKISSANSLYPYRAFITNSLSYHKGLKSTLLANEGYIDKYSSWEHNNDWLQSVNREINLYGRPQLDMFMQDRLIPPGINVRLKFTRSPEAFAVQRPETDEVGDNAQKKLCMSILDMSLTVRWVELFAFKEAFLENSLSKQNAIYPIRQVEMSSISLIPGLASYRFDNIKMGVLPTTVIIGLVAHSAALGKAKEDPFEFKFFGLKEIDLKKNGVSVNIPYKIDEASESCRLTKSARPYSELFKSAGCSNYIGNGISLGKFQKSLALFPYDLSADNSNNDHSFTSPVLHGNLGLHLQFKQNIGSPLNVIILAEYNSTVEIDKLRNIILDY